MPPRKRSDEVESDSGWSDRHDLMTKNLVQSVRNGRRVTLYPFDADEIVGYVAGMDDDTIFILEPREGGFNEKYVRRDIILLIQVHKPSTYEEEPQHAAMEDIIHKFRTWIMKNIYNQRPKANSPG